MSKQASLKDELVAVRDHYHTKNHPFFDLWAQGKLTKPQMGYYLIQHSRMTRDGLRAYAMCYVKAPRDVQDHILSNLAEESGAKALTEESEAVDHGSLIDLWTAECGYQPAQVAEIESVAGAEAIRHHWMHLAYHYPWPVFLSAMTVMESQEVGMQGRLVPALLRHYGYKQGDRRIHFFEEHYEADQVHAQRNFEYLDKYVQDPDLWSVCLEHAELICKLRWQYMNAIHRHAVLGEIEPMPPKRQRGPRGRT